MGRSRLLRLGLLATLCLLGLGPAWERLRLLPREFADLWPRRRNRT